MAATPPAPSASAAELDAVAASFGPIYASGRIPPGLTPHVAVPNVPSTPTSTKTNPHRAVVVWVDGCFDMMHYGHANALRQAREMGDILVVGVHSDAEIAMHKGPPVMREEERYAAVAACKWVDVVVPRAPYFTSLHVLDAFRADFCVHGDDITTLADGTDCYHAVKAANRYRECARTLGVSTTELVGRMLLMTRDHHNHKQQQDEQQLNFSTPQKRGGSTDANNDAVKTTPELSSSVRSTVSASSKSKSASPNAPLLVNTGAPAGPSNAGYYEAAMHATTPSYRIAQFSDGREPRPDQRVAYVAGDFDLFHIGHVECLRAVRAIADFVLVGVYDDRTVNALRGDNAPLMALNERVLGVLACRYVDEVVIGAPRKLTRELLDTYHVSVVVTFPKAEAPGNYTETEAEADDDDNVDVSGAGGAVVDEVNDDYAEPRKRGILVSMQWPDSPLARFSTSSILWRIINQRKLYEERNRRKLNKAVAAATAPSTSSPST